MVDAINTRSSTGARLYVTINGVEFLLRGTSAITPPKESRDDREVRAFENFPRTQYRQGWIGVESLTATAYFNPGDPAQAALEGIKGQNVNFPIRIEFPRGAEIAARTDLRLSLAGVVTFSDVSSGPAEVLFVYQGFAVGTGAVWVTGAVPNEKIYAINSFDAEGRATVRQINGTLAAAGANTAAALHQPKFESRFSGYWKAGSPTLETDDEAMVEYEFGIASNVESYLEGVLLG